MTMRVPLMIIPAERVKFLTGRLRGLAGKIVEIFPKLRVELVAIEAKVRADEYVTLSFLTALLYSWGMFFLLSFLLYFLGASLGNTVVLSSISGLVIFLLFFVLFLFYPHILAGKKAEQIEKELVFALKDMVAEINSGATVYQAIVEVSKADYGQVSQEFKKVVQKVETGTPEGEALEKLALRTTSEPFRNSLWQIINALKAGSNIKNALKELIKDLSQGKRSKIKNYARELNVMALLYMLFAVVIPTITITLLIVAGPFVGLNLGPHIFYILIPVFLFIQVALLELIKSRRPVVQL